MDLNEREQTFQQFLDIIKDGGIPEEVSGNCSKCAFVDVAEKEVDRLTKHIDRYREEKVQDLKVNFSLQKEIERLKQQEDEWSGEMAEKRLEIADLTSKLDAADKAWQASQDREIGICKLLGIGWVLEEPSIEEAIKSLQAELKEKQILIDTILATKNQEIFFEGGKR